MILSNVRIIRGRSALSIERAKALQEALTKFAGREVFLSMREDTPDAGARDALKKALTELREKLQEHPGALAGKPEIVRRWIAPPGRLSPQRLKEWTLSRMCLVDVAELMLASEGGASSGSAMLLSLSHTKGLGIAVGVFVKADEKPHLVGLGVDCELAHRKADGGVAMRIRHPDDRTDALDFITIWTAKEACVKADPSPAATLTSFALKCYRDTFTTGSLQALGERVDYRIWVDDVGEFRIAVAFGYASHPLAVVQHETVEKGWRPE